MLSEFKKYTNYFLFLFGASAGLTILFRSNYVAFGICLGVALISGASLLCLVIGSLLSKQDKPKATAINSGASNDYLTVETSGLVTINSLFGEKMVFIPTKIKTEELLALEGDQMIDRNDIRAVTFHDDTSVGLYYPYGESDSWLIIVSREDLSKLVK